MAVRIEQALDLARWPADRQVLFSTLHPVDTGAEAYEADELRQIETGFGWSPKEQVVCASMIDSDPLYHRLLAEGAYRIAEEFRGVVDLGGVLGHPVDDAGTRVAVSYAVTADRRAVHWVVDLPWLAAWMGHPEFRMVK